MASVSGVMINRLTVQTVAWDRLQSSMYIYIHENNYRYLLTQRLSDEYAERLFHEQKSQH